MGAAWWTSFLLFPAASRASDFANCRADRMVMRQRYHVAALLLGCLLLTAAAGAEDMPSGRPADSKTVPPATRSEPGKATGSPVGPSAPASESKDAVAEKVKVPPGGLFILGEDARDV